MLRLQMVIQLILPSETIDTLATTATHRTVVFLRTVLMFLQMTAEVGGMLDGCSTACVRAVVSLVCERCRWTSDGRGRVGGPVGSVVES